MKSLWKLPGGKFIIVFLSALAIAQITFVAESYWGRQTLLIEVKWIDAVDACTGSGGRRIFNSRSAVPTRSGSHYCGLVRTSHGLIQMPEDGFLFPGNRKEFIDTLKLDCRFEVVVAGNGPDLYEGRPMHNRYFKTLRKIERVFDCSDDTLA
ncbi:MAG: hypothetical protein ABJO29_07290 [Yoonia sp.]|uniref:hypothetical protein n=1 Tax=Yoonia sp. TaxID=2212373 RepID=UPI003267FB3E